MSKFRRLIIFWKLNVKKYFFRYRYGFFELFMIANSPHIMLQNIRNMPLVKHDPKCQIISTENMFLKVSIFYLQLNQDVLLMLSDGFYKKNVLDVMLYDEHEPLEHYFLSLRTFNGTVSSSSTLVNHTGFSSNTWSLCKPAGVKNVGHFKNANEQFFTVYFTQKWLDRYLQTCDERTKIFFKEFIESENTFLMWPRYTSETSPDYSLFYNVFKENKPVSEIDHENFMATTLTMMEEFASCLSNDSLKADHLRMTNENRLKLLKAENYLSQFFTSNFPGVENIAQHVGISPTGLKAGFNQLFGCTVFKYYRSRKMKIACSILQNNKAIKIKELAAQLGYENAAKFTTAFKEETGALPSEVVQLQE